MKDLEEIAGLLHLHKEAVAHGPALSHIANAAYARLRELNAELDPHPASTFVPTAFDKEVPPRNVVPERKPIPVPASVIPPGEPVPEVERVPDGELIENDPSVPRQPVVEPETQVERRDL